jgi:hypothetical protein
MNNENGNRMMMQNRSNVKMMQNNPAMMQSMMTGMMETFKNDTLSVLYGLNHYDKPSDEGSNI